MPELRAAALDQFSQITRQLTDLVAERLGRAADDVAVCTPAGAILGVMISMECSWVDHRDSDLVTLLDEALAHLESGFPL